MKHAFGSLEGHRAARLAAHPPQPGNRKSRSSREMMCGLDHTRELFGTFSME